MEGRVIKFRRFVGGKMDYDPCDGYGSPCPVNDFLSQDNIMEFIGRFDKNGKEIYEGDIMNTVFGEKGVVKMIYDGWYIFLDEGRNCSMSSSIDVLGNIYENPELL